MASAPAYDDATRTSRGDTAKDRKRREEWQKIQDAAEPVVRELGELVKEQLQLRKPIEQRWLEDLRQYHGHYEKTAQAEFKNDESRSEIFINITRGKTNAWAARLGDMLLPNDEKNWGIDPTPVPTLTREAKDLLAEAERADQAAEAAAEKHNEAVEAGTQDPSAPSPAATAAERFGKIAQDYRNRERQLQRKVEIARKCCTAMERLIDDQLTESKFPAKCREAIADMCKLGVGIIKGPIVNSRPKRSWKVEDVAGKKKATLTTSEDPAPTFRRVDPWHFIPDMSASCIEDAGFTFERYLPNRKLLRKMAREMDFNKDTVRELLKPDRSVAANTNADLEYLAELRSLELSASAQDTSMGPLKDRFVIYEYRGGLEVDQIVAMIRASGRLDDADKFEKNADPLKEYPVTVFFCENRLLKIEEDYILDSGDSLYSIASFEKAEASILGAVGVPRLMRHEQSMINSAVRMVMDNAALSVAPQVVIDQNNVEPVDGNWKLTARKLWRRIKGSTGGTGPEYKPFEVFPIPLNQAQLAAIVEMALRFVDEAVAMPLIAQGEQGSHVTETAQGMTMLMNSANVVFRRVVKNYDDDMIGLITRTYDFNMQFSDDQNIKGDAKIEARGTSVLLVREVQSQQLQMLLREWSVHPTMGVAVRAYNMMRMVLQAMSINPDDVLVSEDDYMQKLAEMAAPDEQKDSPEAIRAQTQLQVAQIESEKADRQMATDKEIAAMRRDTEFAKLAQSRDISLAQVQAMFRGKQLDTAAKLETKKIDAHSRERALAAEIAVERENKREAEAKGLEPTGSGGAVSMGAEKRAGEGAR